MPGTPTVEELRAEVDAGRIDTVLLAIADMQGRLQGKRLAAGTSSTRCWSTTPRAATTCWPSTWT